MSHSDHHSSRKSPHVAECELERLLMSYSGMQVSSARAHTVETASRVQRQVSRYGLRMLCPVTFVRSGRFRSYIFFTVFSLSSISFAFFFLNNPPPPEISPFPPPPALPT